MTLNARSPIGGNLAEYLAQADAAILPRDISEAARLLMIEKSRKLRVGENLDTACLVLVVLDEDGVPYYAGIPTRTTANPLFVTPLGMALHDPFQ